jgi:hypothetical protein
MNTQALLTDLTSEQEENVNGGILWFVVIPGVILGHTLWWHFGRRR